MNEASNIFKVGLVQMTSSDIIDDNINNAETLIRQAASQGADFVLTPEMTTLFSEDSKSTMAKISSEADDKSWRHFARFKQITIDMYHIFF